MQIMKNFGINDITSWVSLIVPSCAAVVHSFFFLVVKHENLN
jgi:hypothetical protein